MLVLFNRVPYIFCICYFGPGINCCTLPELKTCAIRPYETCCMCVLLEFARTTNETVMAGLAYIEGLVVDYLCPFMFTLFFGDVLFQQNNTPPLSLPKTGSRSTQMYFKYSITLSHTYKI